MGLIKPLSFRSAKPRCKNILMNIHVETVQIQSLANKYLLISISESGGEIWYYEGSSYILKYNQTQCKLLGN